MTEKSEDINKNISEAPTDIRRIIERVLKVEQDKLYLNKPHVVSDIVNIIKEEIK